VDSACKDQNNYQPSTSVSCVARGAGGEEATGSAPWGRISILY